MPVSELDRVQEEPAEVGKLKAVMWDGEGQYQGHRVRRRKVESG